jgi:hypothetical protein
MLRIHVDPWFLRAGSNSPSAKRLGWKTKFLALSQREPRWYGECSDLNWFFTRIAHMFPAPTYLDLGAMSSSWGELRWTSPPKFWDDPKPAALLHTALQWKAKVKAPSFGQGKTTVQWFWLVIPSAFEHKKTPCRIRWPNVHPEAQNTCAWPRVQC